MKTIIARSCPISGCLSLTNYVWSSNDGSNWQPPPVLIAIHSSPWYLVICNLCRRSSCKQRMYVRSTEQPTLVNCLKSSLLVLYNSHSLHHSNIVRAGAINATHQMLGLLQTRVKWPLRGFIRPLIGLVFFLLLVNKQSLMTRLFFLAKLLTV